MVVNEFNLGRCCHSQANLIKLQSRNRKGRGLHLADNPDSFCHAGRCHGKSNMSEFKPINEMANATCLGRRCYVSSLHVGDIKLGAGELPPS